jgi:RimJ/RimL family protein N-acetyltransferase
MLAGDLERANRLLGLELPPSWPEELQDLLLLRIDQMQREPDVQQWLVRIMVLRNAVQPRTVIGNVGFHGPPREAGEVEIGYSVLPEYQRQGYATQAVTALLQWAAREHAVSRFVASVSPSNVASLRVVKKLGFVQVGRHIDERDGEELVFELVHQA